MRVDPHAGYMPGMGCGCELCRQNIPDGRQVDLREGERRAAYEADRVEHRITYDIPATAWRKS